MKIARLHLLAFGPFTDFTLDFSQGSEGLHLVYGPNEAGKSSSLRAIRDMLFGIPNQTSDSFVHDYSRLRIGASLRTETGDFLDVVRRKGHRQTLRSAADEKPVDEEDLVRLLGGVDRELFESMFGIDHERLCEGGLRILQGGGRLGELLFSAGAGIANLRAIQAKVADQSEELYKPRASIPAINKTTRLLDDARRDLKSCLLAVDDWTRCEAALRAAEQEKERLDDRSRQLRAEHLRLTRIRDAMVTVSQWRKATSDLAAIGCTPRLPDGYSQRRHEANIGLRLAREQHHGLSTQIELLERELLPLEIPTGILDAANEIERLRESFGSYRKAMQDRPALVRDLALVEHDMAQVLAAMGTPTPGDRIESLRVSDQRRERIQSLGSQRDARFERREASRRELDKARRKIGSVEEEITALPLPADPGELRHQLRIIQNHGDIESDLAALEHEVAELQSKARASLKRWKGFQGSLSDLQSLGTPVVESVDHFEEELRQLADRLSRTQSEIDTIQREQLELQAREQCVDQSGDLPTESDLRAARALRDEGWQLVLQVWRNGSAQGSMVGNSTEPGGASDPDRINQFMAGFPDAVDLAGAYRMAVRDADRIADRLRHEAERVANKILLRSQLELGAMRLQGLEKERDRTRGELLTLEGTWRDLWTSVGVVPLSPREMRAWVRQKEALCQTADMILSKQHGADQLRDRISAHRDTLLAQLQSLGLPIDTEVNSSLNRLVSFASTIVDSWTAARDRSQLLRENLASSKQAVENALAEATSTERLMTQWEAEWEAEMGHLGLERDASPAEALSVLGNRAELFHKRSQAESLRTRIQGIDEDAARFTDDVERLARELAIELDGADVPRLIGELGNRLNTARDIAKRHDALHARLAELRRRQQDEAAAIKRWQAELVTLCEIAHVTTPGEIETVERSDAQRRDLESALRRLEQQIAECAGGKGLEAFVAEVENEMEQADTLPARIDDLDQGIDDVVQERDRSLATIAEQKSALAQMTGSAAAAEKAEECEQLVARTHHLTRQYAVLRIATNLLRTAIERYRQKNQGPVLDIASRLFADMTLNVYSGLGCDFNEQGDPILVGLRAGDNRQVMVEGMSDGTRDQLYLALRLASLELWLKRHPALPFIIDDVLIHFDDRRAVAALRALGELSRRTQVIFFTHHRHLVDIAVEHLPDDLLFVHRMSGREEVTAPSSVSDPLLFDR